LEREGYIELTDELDNPSRIMVVVDKNELYKFQVANPDLDGFVKILLRNLAGLFSDYVRVDEAYIAKISALPIKKVTENLLRLGKAKVINYIPRKKTPLVIFTEERLDEKNLYISRENYNDRKDRYLKRIEAMLDYATSTTKCRSQSLLEYFGEKDAYRCGKCDVCTSRNELNMSKYQFDQILDKLKQVLANGPLGIEQLVDSVQQPSEKTTLVVRWLMDNGKIQKNSEGLLAWRK
jgi:ATP-dependent DNA helicase RecQ